jgi:hypothetical protein
MDNRIKLIRGKTLLFLSASAQDNSIKRMLSFTGYVSDQFVIQNEIWSGEIQTFTQGVPMMRVTMHPKRSKTWIRTFEAAV